MPAGNPYTRPANRSEREAMTRQSARNAAMKNIDRRSGENIEDVIQPLDEFHSNDTSLRKMKGYIKEAGSADREVLSNMKQKESRRKADRYSFKDGGMVRGCKSSQMSGKGFRGTY